MITHYGDVKDTSATPTAPAVPRRPVDGSVNPCVDLVFLIILPPSSADSSNVSDAHYNINHNNAFARSQIFSEMILRPSRDKSALIQLTML